MIKLLKDNIPCVLEIQATYLIDQFGMGHSFSRALLLLFYKLVLLQISFACVFAIFPLLTLCLIFSFLFAFFFVFLLFLYLFFF